MGWLGSFFWAIDDLYSHEGISVLIVLINVFFLLYLFLTTVGDSWRDYKVAEKTKAVTRQVFNRLSALCSCASGRGASGSGTQLSSSQDAKKRTSSVLDREIAWPEEEVKVEATKKKGFFSRMLKRKVVESSSSDSSDSE